MVTLYLALILDPILFSTDSRGGRGHAGEQLRGGDGDHASAGRRREGAREAVRGRGGLLPDEVQGVRHHEEDRQGAQDAHQAHAPAHRKASQQFRFLTCGLATLVNE